MSLVGFKARNHPQQRAKPEVDERQTPPELFDPLNERFRFTLDACALPRNAKLPRFFVPPGFTPRRCMWDHPDECGAGGCRECEHGARDRRPTGIDGLSQSWKGERVWCNPPYSSIEPWLEKAWVSGPELVVMLVPANRTEQGWWQRYVEPFRDRYVACGFCGAEEWPGTTLPLRVEFLAGRQRFIAFDADEIKPNERPPFGVCLLIWTRAPVSPVELGTGG